jgi:hypothetical protein
MFLALRAAMLLRWAAKSVAPDMTEIGQAAGMKALVADFLVGPQRLTESGSGPIGVPHAQIFAWFTWFKAGANEAAGRRSRSSIVHVN